MFYSSQQRVFVIVVCIAASGLHAIANLCRHGYRFGQSSHDRCVNARRAGLRSLREVFATPNITYICRVLEVRHTGFQQGRESLRCIGTAGERSAMDAAGVVAPHRRFGVRAVFVATPQKAVIPAHALVIEGGVSSAVVPDQPAERGAYSVEVFARDHLRQRLAGELVAMAPRF